VCSSVSDPECSSRIRIEEIKYFNPKNCLLALVNVIRDVFSRDVFPGILIPDPDVDFFLIPDPGSRDQKDSRYRIRNTGSV